MLMLASALASPLDTVDWNAAEAELTELLSSYLQVDTTNPPGRESAGAFFLAERLAAEGIASEVVGEPGRGNLVARLPGTGEKPPLCLLSHTDVVTAEEALWEHPPLSGFVDEEGWIWGRGALDMKSMGALELMTLVWAKRLGLALDRDLILLAVADEEVDNSGVKYLAERWEDIGCSHVLNEGGVGITDLLFPGQTAWPISVGEKGILWLRVTAHGKPGHGSTPLPEEAPMRLLEALDGIRRYDPEAHIQPELELLLGAAGRHAGGFTGWVMAHPGLTRPLLTRSLLANPLTRAAITDTVHITGLEGAMQPNVVPASASALLDCRLLPGTSPEALVAHIEALIDDPLVELEILDAQPAAVSPVDDPLYRALERQLLLGREDAVAGPVISVGFTDSIYLRPLGVRAYGLVPLEVSTAELQTMHGPNERVHREELGRGLERLLRVVVDFAGQP